MSEYRFVVGSLGSGGISEAASLGEQRWRLSAGVLRLRPDSDRGSESPLPRLRPRRWPRR
jgi:hypothetical protein